MFISAQIILGIFGCIFSKKKSKVISPAPPIPPIEEITEDLYGKGLSFSDSSEVIRVIYSSDRTRRFIILKSAEGCYRYTYEKIYVCDKEEWEYFFSAESAAPAWWLPYNTAGSYSFFGTETEALASLAFESEYKLYFDQNLV